MSAPDKPDNDPGDPHGGKSSPAKLPELVQVNACGDGSAAGLSAAQLSKLQAGGDDAGIKLLYPYDKTVFPRGLAAPLVMWSGAPGAAAYVKIRSKYFEYDGCLPTGADGELQLNQDGWDQAGRQTLGPETPFEIEISVLDGDTVHGPIKLTLIIAQATIKGSIFYNSYNSNLAGGLVGAINDDSNPLAPVLGGLGGQGAILRIKPGKDAEYFARRGACTGCHALSANGERLVATELPAIPEGQIYELRPDTPALPPPSRAAQSPAFVGLTPDGVAYLSTAVGGGLGPAVRGGVGNTSVQTAELIETDTGMVVPDTGIPSSAMMPTFSVDGTLLTFNDLDTGGKSISLMDYDGAARKASNLRTIATTPSYAGWPFLLPDNGGVIFTDTDNPAFAGNGVGILNVIPFGPRSDLAIADVETGKTSMLAKAMGFTTPDDAAAGNTYLPFGDEELHKNYYPTVSPIAAGGYFWVFFDSVRHYGNKGSFRQLWVTAVAIQHDQGEFNRGDGLYALDPSAPAFYLPGQELMSANHRAFTGRDPCRDDGAGCESGVDCCSGYCNDGVCGPPQGCADTNEACVEDEDCCNGPSDRCIAGFCGTVFL